MVFVISLFISLDINRVRGGVCSSFFDVFSEEESCGVGYYSKNQITKKDILRMQDLLRNKTQVETVNFRVYFKVIIRKHDVCLSFCLMMTLK